MWISPPLASSSPAIMRRIVDLPQPDGPTSTTNSSCATSRSMPRTASTAPNCLRSPFSASCAMTSRLTQQLRAAGDAAGDFPRQQVFRGALARGERVMRCALLRDLAAIAREARGERRRRRSALHRPHGDEMLGCGEAPEIGFAKARGPADRRGEYLLRTRRTGSSTASCRRRSCGARACSRRRAPGGTRSPRCAPGSRRARRA